MTTNNFSTLTDSQRIDLERLKWACRRGMLELDVLLGNFLQYRYANLSPELQTEFKQLLSQADAVLFSWLLGESKPDGSYINIVNLIRAHNHRVV